MVLLALVLATFVAPVSAATYFVDGACPQSGAGTALRCGPSGPFRTIAEGVDALHARAGREPLVLNVRGAHDGFDGVYPEFVKLFGTRALECSAKAPCTIQGCAASTCGRDESFTVSGFMTPPRDGWSSEGGGVFSRRTTAADEWAGTDNQPYDAHYGAGSGRYNPVYLREGPTKTAMGYGGVCADGKTLCGSDAFCKGACDFTKPLDGKWGFRCSGTDCRLFVNPTGTNDPTKGWPIWIPDRNANLTIDGRLGCPDREATKCPPTEHLTLRRMTLEGSRWTGVQMQFRDGPRQGQGLAFEDVTIRHAPRYGMRTMNVSSPLLRRITVEDMARGLAFDTVGSFGLRLFTWTGGAIEGLTARHLCAAGDERTCPNCDPPWNDPRHTAWGGNCEAWDLKQSDGVTVRGLDVSDVGGGQRIDASHDVVVDGGTVTRARNPLVVNQLTPNAKNGHVRSYNVTIRNLRMSSGAASAIATTAGIGRPEAQSCITPLRAGEWLRIDGNRLTDHPQSGVLVCYNTLVCRGGEKDGGTCKQAGATCPGGTCEPAGPGAGTIEIGGNTISGDGRWGGPPSCGVSVRNDARSSRTMAAANVKVRGNTLSSLGHAGVFLAYETATAPGVEVTGNRYAASRGEPCALAVGRADGERARCVESLKEWKAFGDDLAAATSDRAPRRR